MLAIALATQGKADLQKLNVSTLQSTMCVSSSSSLPTNSSGAVNKRLLETDLALIVAIRHSLRLLVGHVVVRHV